TVSSALPVSARVRRITARAASGSVTNMFAFIVPLPLSPPSHSPIPAASRVSPRSCSSRRRRAKSSSVPQPCTRNCTVTEWVRSSLILTPAEGSTTPRVYHTPRSSRSGLLGGAEHLGGLLAGRLRARLAPQHQGQFLHPRLLRRQWRDRCRGPLRRAA